MMAIEEKNLRNRRITYEAFTEPYNTTAKKKSQVYVHLDRYHLHYLFKHWTSTIKLPQETFK